jgi:DNA-binding NarL/FixJ family response regulator
MSCPEHPMADFKPDVLSENPRLCCCGLLVMEGNGIGTTTSSNNNGHSNSDNTLSLPNSLFSKQQIALFSNRPRYPNITTSICFTRIRWLLLGLVVVTRIFRCPVAVDAFSIPNRSKHPKEIATYQSFGRSRSNSQQRQFHKNRVHHLASFHSTPLFLASNANENHQEEGAAVSEEHLMSVPWIVLVDDEESIRSAVSQLFILNGYHHITTCCNGQEALELLQQQSPTALPDCLVCDIRMPVMDGLELLDCIRQHEEWASLPVILLTAKGLTGDRIQGYDRGADAYLSKPFQPTELLAIVENLLQRTRRQKQQQSQSSVNVQDLQQELDEIKDLLLNKGGAGIGGGWVNATQHVVFGQEEQIILELLSDGLVTKEIAAATRLSTRRIEQLLTGMFRKTQTKNRTELIKWAVSNGHVE